MKILYVEDELAKNIPRITRLFSKYLGKKRAKELEALGTSESGFRPDLEKVKHLVEETGIIEVERRFSDALRKIVNHADKYALFIIDRNLSDCDYSYEEVNKIDPAYNETLYEAFFEREGDYFLQKLMYSGVDVMTKFYFLTAYPAQDELRNGKEIEMHINFGKFKVDNFIEKGNEGDFERLQQVMENTKILNLQSENWHYLNILQNNIDDETAGKFLKVLDEKDDAKKIGDTLIAMRIIYEEILRICATKIPGMKANCTNKYGQVIMGRKTVDWLLNEKLINSIIYQFSLSLKAIASDFGGHKSETAAIYKPTIDTVNTLVYALKDIISWFGEICKKYPK